MRYRAEIDGLRAIAIVPVILFHAGFELFSGGFVGVDVFFVVSGYLITTTLIEDLESGCFSIGNFYERRARRILPALFFVMIVCIPFAWMWMLPSQLASFALSLVSVSLFVSNMFFWKESGYFAPAAEAYPLLHTWSLAVEEQYYILFPIFLFLVWRLGKKKVFFMIVVLAAISLILSEWGWRNWPAANFYLAPTRAWELLAGSISAFIAHKRGVQANNTLSLLGFSAILFAIFVYDESTPFPSIYTLVPIVGVVLLILFAEKQSGITRLLSYKYLVGVGLVSYSTYLWHQPIFAFARIRSLNSPTNETMILLSLLSVFIGWLSWKYVERPFRNRIYISSKWIALLTIAGTCAFTLIGLTYARYSTELDHYSDAVLAIDSFEARTRLDRDAACTPVEGKPKACVLGNSQNIKGALLGDSHAKMLWQPLNSQLNQLSVGVESFTRAGCPPIRNVYRRDLAIIGCYEFTSAVLDKVADSNEIEFVILSGRWTIYIENLRFDNGEGDVEPGADFNLDIVKNGERQRNIDSIRQKRVLAQIETTIKALIESGKIVFVVHPVPEVGFHVPQRLAKVELFGIESYLSTHSYHRFLSRNKKVRDLFVKLNQPDNDNLYFFDISESICSEISGRCSVLGDDLQPLYFDSNHLSSAGSEIIVTQIVTILRELLFLPGSLTQ